MKDPWRYRCPEGHSNWNYDGAGGRSHFCQTCGEAFDRLLDMKTNERVSFND